MNGMIFSYLMGVSEVQFCNYTNPFPTSQDFCRLLHLSVYVLRKPIPQTIWTQIRLLPISSLIGVHNVLQP